MEIDGHTVATASSGVRDCCGVRTRCGIFLTRQLPVVRTAVAHYYRCITVRLFLQYGYYILGVRVYALGVRVIGRIQIRTALVCMDHYIADLLFRFAFATEQADGRSVSRTGVVVQLQTAGYTVTIRVRIFDRMEVRSISVIRLSVPLHLVRVAERCVGNQCIQLLRIVRVEHCTEDIQIQCIVCAVALIALAGRQITDSILTLHNELALTCTLFGCQNDMFNPVAVLGYCPFVFSRHIAVRSTQTVCCIEIPSFRAAYKHVHRVSYTVAVGRAGITYRVGERVPLGLYIRCRNLAGCVTPAPPCVCRVLGIVADRIVHCRIFHRTDDQHQFVEDAVATLQSETLLIHRRLVMSLAGIMSRSLQISRLGLCQRIIPQQRIAVAQDNLLELGYRILLYYHAQYVAQTVVA